MKPLPASADQTTQRTSVSGPPAFARAGSRSTPVNLPRPVHVVVRDQAVVLTVHEWRGDHEIRGRPIAGDGNVPHLGHAQQRLDVRVVRLRFQRIPEEDQEVDFSARDPGADLLVTAEWSALQLVDRETEVSFQNAAGGTGGVHLMVRQQVTIEGGPLEQVTLLVVMRDQGDLLVADSTACRAAIPRDAGPGFHGMPGHRSTLSRAG